VQQSSQTHSAAVGYALWIFGFTGSHRFYFGKPISGTIWFFTLGLLGIGWLIDIFLIPGMNRDAALRFHPGRIDYNAAWILLTFLGLLGIHRMYMGKWLTGLLYLVTGAIVGIGYLYDYWTLNDQITLINSGRKMPCKRAPVAECTSARPTPCMQCTGYAMPFAATCAAGESRGI
jgi:TM2 domain-containing membrane protein YozV